MSLYRVVTLVILAVFLCKNSYSSDFMSICTDEYSRQKADLKWLKSFFKTKNCLLLKKKISRLKSLSEIIPPTIFSPDLPPPPAWVNDFSYMYGIQKSKIDLFDEREYIFVDISMLFLDFDYLKEFTNLKHLIYDSKHAFTRLNTLCSILNSFPQVEQLTIEAKLITLDSLACIESSKLKSVIVSGRYTGEQKLPNDKIIGFEEYLDVFSKLIDYPNLRYLGISSYSPYQGSLATLSQRVNISHLSLNLNSVKDIFYIGNLVNLKHLTLNCYFINHAEKDYGCKSENSLKRIDFLSQIPFLTYLDLSHNQIEDISPLMKLKYLKTVDLSSNSLKHIAFFTKFKTIKNLNLTSNLLEDDTILINFPSLITLRIGSNKIQNFKNLHTIKNLKFLDISENFYPIDLENILLPNMLIGLNISGTSPLSSEAVNNQVDAHELLGLKENNTTSNTASLFLSESSVPVEQNDKPLLNKTPNLSLKSLKNLEVLIMKNNNLQEFPVINTLQRLKYLDLENNSIIKIPEKTMGQKLITLKLSRNKFEAFPDLRNFKNIKNIFLINNSIKDIERISTVKNDTTRIFLNKNKIKDISLLTTQKFTNFSFELDFNPVEKNLFCGHKVKNVSLIRYCYSNDRDPLVDIITGEFALQSQF